MYFTGQLQTRMCYFFYVISNTYVILFFLISGLFCSGTFAQVEELDSVTEEVEEKPKTVAIQNRPYILNKEFGVYYSYMPLDHFNHFHSLGMNYLNYYNDYLAWEVFNVASVSKESTGLANRLLNDFGAVPDTFDILQYYFTTSIIYTPIYMKHLYKEKDIRFGDISFVAGAGVSRWERALNANMIEFGFITRFIRQEGLNFKFDVRYKTFLGGDLRPNMSLGLVLTYNFMQEVKNKKVFDEE